MTSPCLHFLPPNDSLLVRHNRNPNLGADVLFGDPSARSVRVLLMASWHSTLRSNEANLHSGINGIPWSIDWQQCHWQWWTRYHFIRFESVNSSPSPASMMVRRPQFCWSLRFSCGWLMGRSATNLQGHHFHASDERNTCGFMHVNWTPEWRRNFLRLCVKTVTYSNEMTLSELSCILSTTSGPKLYPSKPCPAFSLHPSGIWKICIASI